MKFCPYCGAAIIGGAVPFCAECGKPLPNNAKTQPSAQKPVPSTAKPRAQEHRKSVKPTQTPPKRSKPRYDPRKTPQKKPNTRPKPDPRDDGYDGYYSDIEPIDRGHTKDRMDSELVKRIIILSTGAFFFVILAVVLMSLL